MQIDDIYEIYDSTERKWLVDNCDAVRAMMKRPEQPDELPKDICPYGGCPRCLEKYGITPPKRESGSEGEK